MKIINFKKVAGGNNDAAVEYFVPADKILAMESDTSNGKLYVFLRAVDDTGTTDNAAGDNITITCAGKAEQVGDFIAERLYGNFQSGPVVIVDNATLGGAISASLLTPA
tara:strand:- start:343 stop:669 length:327 start_codon:yes stop_codon:yes gene_type:complete